uniref:Uncharacterized protein n=1 Tax=Polynucleobacter necessarius subsp. necessarius (strain STIR1) TaxID=452638 RepID=B1XRZ7_POLNS
MAGVRMGAGGWAPGGQITGLILVGVIWAVTIPLFSIGIEPIKHGLVKNP